MDIQYTYRRHRPSICTHIYMYIHVCTYLYCEWLDLDLGKTGTGERVSDVILPPWASSPEEFIRINKAALVSLKPTL